jgi:hypothetical protein
MHKWSLTICWRLGFSGKGFHILSILELRAISHFFSLVKDNCKKDFLA